MILRAVPLASFVLILALAAGTPAAHAEKPATSKAHQSSKPHVALGVDLGWAGPFDGLGLRLELAPHSIFSVELGGGIGFYTAAAGLLFRARATGDQVGASVAVGLSSGVEYGSADGEEQVGVTRGVLELAVQRHLGRHSSLSFRAGVKASEEPVVYTSSTSAGDYYDELDQYVPFFGITLSVVLGG